MGLKDLWLKVPHVSRPPNERELPPNRRLTTRIRARVSLVSQAVRGKYPHHDKDHGPEEVAEVTDVAAVAQVAVAEVAHIPRARPTNRHAVYGGIRTLDGSLAVIDGDLSIPKIVVYPPSHSDRNSVSAESTPMDQKQWSTPAPHGYNLTQDIKNQQSGDNKGSVYSFEKGDDRISVLLTTGLHEVPQIKPLKINRTSVARSEMAIFDYAEDPVEAVARRVTMKPSRPLLQIINELRSDDPGFQSKLGGALPDTGRDKHVSLSSNSVFTEPSRFSLFADDAIFEIDNMIEMYSSLSDSDDSLADVPGASSNAAPIKRHSSVSTTSPSFYGDVIDPSMQSTVRRSYYASSNDMTPLPTATYLSPPSPERSSRQLTTHNYSRYPPRFDSLNPLQYSEAEIAYLRAEQELLASVDEIPPPIPERSPARLQARTTSVSLPASTAGM